ncbi:hypothetical protein SLE2022_099960 [Rubroshorea leprosula]
MKGQDAATAIPTSVPSPRPSTTVKKDGSVAAVIGQSGYKFWALAALLLLAFWSIFTGSVSLKWSSADLTRFSSHDANFSVHDDLDILELEEREKVVRKMWDVYTQRPNAPLTRFWLEAFEAAYEYLSSDVPGIRDAAVSEIAKLSMRSVNLDPLSVHSVSTTQEKQEQKNKKISAFSM